MTKRKKQADSGRKKSNDGRGRLVRAFRKSYDVTLEQMAELAELSQPMLTRFETGTRNLSAEAWTRLLIAMGKIEKEKGAEHKARFTELHEQWMNNFSPGIGNLFSVFNLPGIEAEMHRIVEKDQSRLEVSKAVAAQLPEAIPALQEKILADVLTHIHQNPEQAAREYFALMEWRQKVLDMEAQGHTFLPKTDVEAKDRRIAELEKQLEAYQEQELRRAQGETSG